MLDRVIFTSEKNVGMDIESTRGEKQIFMLVFSE